MTTKKNNSVAIVSPSKLLELGIKEGISVEQLGQLMDLQERWDAQQARKAFLLAMTSFQNKCPILRKTKKVQFDYKNGGGSVNYNYAPLSEIIKTIKDLLQQCGLSYRWETDSKEANRFAITCIVSHVDGHCESNTMVAGKDTSGKKNEIQQQASTVTYLQRYTLIGALGIATAEDDVDGQKKPVKITSQKSTELLGKAKIIVEEHTDPKELKASSKAHIQDQTVAGMHQKDLKALQAFINKRYVALKKEKQTQKISLP